MKQDRRKFIKNTSTAALYMSALESFSLPKKTEFSMDNNYKLTIMATSWGFDGSMDEFCAKVKKEGYDGV